MIKRLKARIAKLNELQDRDSLRVLLVEAGL
jgi:hypothetical protein